MVTRWYTRQVGAGAVVTLKAAAELPQITRLAVYEPPLTSSADDASWDWPRHSRGGHR